MPRRLMLVSHSDRTRVPLSDLLSPDYHLLLVDDGDAAIALLEQEPQISAIFWDDTTADTAIFLEKLQKDSSVSAIPRILILSSPNEAREQFLFSCGADEVVILPYRSHVLQQRLSTLIRLYEASALASATAQDDLTTLYNKDAFYQRVTEALRAYPTQAFDMIAMDINRFKLVNDIYGVPAGDRLLLHLAQLLQEHVPAEAGFCARIYGDQFMMFTTRRVGEVERLARIVTNALIHYPLDMQISVKFGVYPITDKQLAVSILCDRAMLALRGIKGNYSQQYAYYDDSVRLSLLSEQEILNEMESALREEQFEVYLQPKFDLASEKIAGAEALVRWNHPTRGLLTPHEFIPIFERNGFISQLDSYVIRKTCSILRSFLDNGYPCVPISVNISRVDIYNVNLPNLLLELLDTYGLRPNHLRLEIAETTCAEHSEQLIGIITALKSLGFSIEMDDFGNGYSSLNLLSELPIDALKFNMKFIRTERNQSGSRNILNFIVNLAKWMDLLVVAEGVETREQIELLRNTDCNYVQGYYYAKPMPPSKFMELLSKSGVIESLTLGAAPALQAPTLHHGGGEQYMLIVDDVALNRAILLEIFSPHYSIIEAENGAVAYDYLLAHANQVAIIMLDLVMPVMNGFQLLEKLHADPILNCIPVIVTSQAGESSEARALEMGAADFVAKPYHPDVALHRVRNVMAHLKLESIEREKALLLRMQQMERASKHDSLTGLCNRAELEKQIIDFFAAQPQAQASFIIVDIDHFKEINDTLGHTTGDDAICMVAQRLQACFRTEDVVCRMGGDEFSVFVKVAFSLQDLQRRLDQLCDMLCFELDGLSVSCSIGACLAPEHGQDYHSLYQNSDIALLTAKRLGKRQYQIFGGEQELPSQVLFRNFDWLLDETSDAILVCDTEEYNILYLNQVACQLIGQDRQNCIGKKCYEVMWNRTEPCPYCIPLEHMCHEYCSYELFDASNRKTYLVKGKLTEWGTQTARLQYIQDNTAQAAFKQQLVKTNEQLSALLSASQSGSVKRLTDECQTLITANDTKCFLT